MTNADMLESTIGMFVRLFAERDHDGAVAFCREELSALPVFAQEYGLSSEDQERARKLFQGLLDELTTPPVLVVPVCLN
jgi:hypothetical protein